MDSTTFNAFGDELVSIKTAVDWAGLGKRVGGLATSLGEKIAPRLSAAKNYLGEAAANLGHDIKRIGGFGKELVQEGWRGPPLVDAAGKAVAEIPRSQKIMTRVGQGLTLVDPALRLPGALRKEDPTGQGRSRAERLAGVAGRTVSGLALQGGMQRALAASGLKSSLVREGLATAGATALGDKPMAAGEWAATAPWKLKRRLMGQSQPQTQMTSAQPPADYQY